jgi:hypothetical protein
LISVTPASISTPVSPSTARRYVPSVNLTTGISLFFAASSYNLNLANLSPEITLLLVSVFTRPNLYAYTLTSFPGI